MKILVDADAIPKILRESICTVAEREQIDVYFVSATIPRSFRGTAHVHAVAAGSAFNGADDKIVEMISSGDLVVTADIPLADRALTQSAEVLNQRGEFFTPANIKNALAMRELLDELRTVGEITGGPAPFSARNRELFLNALDRFLRRKPKPRF